MFYLTMQSIYLIYGYMASDHSDSKRKPAAATTWAVLSDLEQGCFHMHHPLDIISYTMAFVTPVVEH